MNVFRAARTYAAPFALALLLPLIAAGAATVAAASACPPDIATAGAAPAQRRADAVQAFLGQRYATAYGRFAALADDGDASSALMALAMVSQGPVLFGSEWSATEGQLRRWSALAARDLRDHGIVIAEHDRGE